MPNRRAELKSLQYTSEDVEDYEPDDPFDDEIVVPEDEEFGGYAYERLFLDFRFVPPAALSGKELEKYVEWESDPLYGRLDEIMEPSRGDVVAYNRAARIYQRYERHGYPVAGPWGEQPADWLHAMDCVLTAKERAENERAREEAHKAEQEKQSASQAQTAY